MGSLSSTVVDGVATLVVHSARNRNAIDLDVVREMHQVLDHLQRPDSGARALVITGSGGVFCSGVDLSSIDLKSPEKRQRAHSELRRFMDPLILRLNELRLPMVAAINGPAAGVGMSLALATDILIVAEDAYFWPSFAHLGMVPDAGMTFRLARRIGGGRSLSSLLLAEKIDAKTAQEWGLAYAVVPTAEVLTHAQAIAQRLAAGSPAVLAHIRHLHASAFDKSLQEQLRAERSAQEMMLGTRDCVEGVRAFFEKRQPNFTAE